MSKGRFAAGTLLGAVIGLAAGILTAPKSGKETRADLKLKANDLKDNATKKADDLKNKATDVMGDVKDNALDLKERAEKAAAGAKEGFNSKN